MYPPESLPRGIHAELSSRVRWIPAPFSRGGHAACSHIGKRGVAAAAKPVMDRPLRILHILLPDAGGLSRYVVNLSSAMRALGHEVTVAGEAGGASRATFDEARVPYVEISLKGGPIALLKSMSILKRHLREHVADIIHTHYRRATLLARRLQSHGAPPILYTLHLSHISLAGLHRFLSDFG